MELEIYSPIIRSLTSDEVMKGFSPKTIVESVVGKLGKQYFLSVYSETIEL